MATTIITTQQGFDETYYLSAKAAQLTASTGTTWNAAQVLAAIEAAGMTAAEHYSLYGYAEGLSPNAYFNADTYAQNKATAAGISVAAFEIAWYNASGSTNLYLHYLAYGDSEGVNPSSGFDEQAYYTAKAAQMGSGYTWKQARTAIEAAGLTAISHYLLYGINESLSYTPTGSSTTGVTYNLTTGVDTITGTSGNDTINGVLATGAVTLNLFDSIDGDGGTDTLNVNFATTVSTLTSANCPTLSNIEIINLTNLGATGAAATVDASLAPSLTTLNIVSPVATDAIAINNASASLTTIGLSNVTNTADTVTVNYVAGALSGSSDSLTLNLTNVKDSTAAANPTVTIKGGAVGEGAETLTINSVGTNVLGNLVVGDSAASTTLKTLTINGSGSFTDQTAVSFKGTGGTINASNTTGGVNLIVGTQNITMTGGSGNDTLTFAAAGDLNASDSIDMGSGTDTIVLADTAVNSTTTVLNTAITNTGAEIVGFSANATVDMSYLSPAYVELMGTNTLAVTNLATTDTIILNATSATPLGALTATGTLGHNTANIQLAGTSSNYVTAASAALTGQSTINIESDGSTATGNTITAMTVSDSATVNVTGSQALTITTLTGGTTTGVLVNGADMTGALKVSLAAATAASSLVGGSGNDTLVGGNFGDTLVGGAGKDTLTTGVSTVGDSIIGGAGADTINLQGTVTGLAYKINSTAAESYAGDSVATSTNLDTVVATTIATGSQTITFNTSVSTAATSVVAAASASAVYTTAVTAYGFLTYTDAVNSIMYAYQDTNGDGLIESGEWATAINYNGTGDTLASAISSNTLQVTITHA